MTNKTAYSDVDGTLSSGFYIKDLCDALYMADLFSENEYKNAEEIFRGYKSGKLKYAEAAPEAVRTFARGIKHKKKADAEKVGEIYIANHPEKIFSFAEELISKLRYKGYRPVLLSGSPEEIIIPFGRRFGIGPEDTFATEFEVENGIYSGEVLRSMVEQGMKESLVKEHAAKHGIDLRICAALGDTENDVQMLGMVGYPVAIRPNPALVEIAIKREWPICRTDEDVREEIKYLP